MRNEHTANQALYEAAQHRASVVRALATSSTVTRQRYQRSVVKKQQSKVLTMLGYTVLLCSSAVIGILLAA
jgi:hypothetical protein